VRAKGEQERRLRGDASTPPLPDSGNEREIKTGPPRPRARALMVSLFLLPVDNSRPDCLLFFCPGHTGVLVWPFTSARERQKSIFELAELLLVKRVEAEARVEEARANAALKNMERELKFKEQELEFHAVKRQRNRERALLMRKNARPGQRNRFGPLRQIEGPTCGLCADPMRRDVTLEMIALHNQHGDQSAVPQQVNGEARN
jgi:hypothetical protein